MIENIYRKKKTIKSDPSWFPIPFSKKRNQASLEKWLFLGLGQEKYMSLELLKVPESKEVLKTQKHGSISKEH